MALAGEAAAGRDELVGLRRELHRGPEVGLDLPRTQERVLAWLESLRWRSRPGGRCRLSPRCAPQARSRGTAAVAVTSAVALAGGGPGAARGSVARLA
jgi:metal-dependent amidase/aminoacylase/carboxypeptidase family protein